MNLSALIEVIRSELVFKAVRSRGPGGQNVNKVSSAALLLWNFGASNALSAHQKYLVREKLASFVNSEGEIFLRSDEYRDLPRNKERCVEKLRDQLERAFHREAPRRPTKPTRSSKIKQQAAKTFRARIKKSRGKIDY